MKKIMLGMVVVLGLAIVLGIVLYIPSPIPTPKQDMQIIDFALANFDLPTMKKMATLVIVGKVVKQSQGPNDGPIPQINNQIEIERVLKGPSLTNVNVFTPGSMSGKNKVIVVEDQYKLKRGERALFMLFKWKGEYNIVGLAQGKYQIKGDIVRGKFINKGMTVDQFQQSVLGIKMKAIGVAMDKLAPMKQTGNNTRLQLQLQQHDQLQHFDSIKAAKIKNAERRTLGDNTTQKK